jgi:DNA adenine methylase
MRAPFAHQGGKAKIASRIIPLIRPHVCYVEPFCGAASVFFQKQRSQVEVLNDINSEIANTFRCLQRHFDAVLQELHLVVNSREHFMALCDAQSLTDCQRAARFLYLRALSFGAGGSSFGVVKSGGGGARTNVGAIKIAIERVHHRLQGVVIEHKDWLDCLRVYDKATTFFYLDPPYVGGHINNYTPWKIQDLTQAVVMLKGLKGKWLLSMNDTPETRRALKGFRLRSFKRQRGIANKTGADAKPYGELLVSNN